MAARSTPSSRSGRLEWGAIVVLYEHLVLTAPTLGAQVAQAGAVGEAGGPGTDDATTDPNFGRVGKLPHGDKPTEDHESP